jgi:hypothetical protein
VHLEVLGQELDPGSEESYLNFGRAGITLVPPELLDNFVFVELCSVH